MSENIIFSIFFEWIIFFMFSFDIFINLNTAYYKKGEFILSKEKIIKNYIKNEIFFDFITFFPLIFHKITNFQ